MPLGFMMLAQACAPQVDVQTIAAIVKTESNFNPLVIGINGQEKLARQPLTENEAVSTARWLIDNGYNIDMGLGQINSTNLKRVGLTVEEVFDPCKNIGAAAQILKSNYVSAKDHIQDHNQALLASFSAYNTGSFSKGFANGYVQKVISAVDPIPVLVGKTVKTASQPKKKTNDEVVKLTVEKQYPLEPPDAENVYSSTAQNIMVY